MEMKKPPRGCLPGRLNGKLEGGKAASNERRVHYLLVQVKNPLEFPSSRQVCVWILGAPPPLPLFVEIG